MSRFRLSLLAGAVLLLTPAILHACLWDYDTLKMERSRFPSALELITGKFLRHSPEFYEWRVQDRKKRLEYEPDNLALYDDLAVAYDKLGQDDKAIETILLKDKKKPNQYETLANLGTFYIHAGQLEKGVEYIDRAIEVNPNAHFGREKYQKYLVEYILSRRRTAKLPASAVGVSFLAATGRAGKGNKKLPLPLCPCTRMEHGYEDRNGFFEYVSSQEPRLRRKDEHSAGVTGILGIMKFGNFDSPIVLEALGDMLGSTYDRDYDAKQLAARAYLKAALHTSDPEAKKGYRDLAAQVLKMQVGYDGIGGMKLSDLEPSFQQELADANDWYAKLRDDECSWIREGKNPETEFDKLYAADPILTSPDDNKTIPTSYYEMEPSHIRFAIVGVGIGFLLVISAIILSIFVISRIRRKSAQAESQLTTDH